MKLQFLGGPEDGREIEVSDPPPVTLKLPIIGPLPPIVAPANEPPTSPIQTLEYVLRRTYKGQLVYAWEGLP